MLERDVGWFEYWLACDPTFTRQPYQQLAATFRAAGDPDQADAMLRAGRNRELAKKWEEDDYPGWVGLGLLKITIGYGLGSGYWLSLLWVLGFTVLGAVVLWFSQEARAKGPAWCLGASLDHLLPIVELNKDFADFLDDTPGRLTTGQLTYFAFHALVGYVLAGFVVAGDLVARIRKRDRGINQRIQRPTGLIEMRFTCSYREIPGIG